MNETKQYKCVNCGEPAVALFKTYGPTVLKLTKCEKCKGIVDKYIEYDPVIVMIDLVLMSREAQRHVLYNTEFKSYWKLLVILVMLETYSVWRTDSLYSVLVSYMCGFGYNTANDSQLVVPLSSWVVCAGWRPDGADVFIWEKDFYIKFIAIFTGIAVYIATTHGLMTLLKPATCKKVCVVLSVKSFCLSAVWAVLGAVWAVWGAGGASRLAHHCAVFVYSMAVCCNVFTALYECSLVLGGAVVSAGVVAKHAATLYVTAGLNTYLI